MGDYPELELTEEDLQDLLFIKKQREKKENKISNDDYNFNQEDLENLLYIKKAKQNKSNNKYDEGITFKDVYNVHKYNHYLKNAPIMSHMQGFSSDMNIWGNATNDLMHTLVQMKVDKDAPFSEKIKMIAMKVWGWGLVVAYFLFIFGILYFIFILVGTFFK